MSSTPVESSTVANWIAELRAAAPISKLTTCWRRPATTRSPGSAKHAQRDLIGHHARDEEDRRLFSDQFARSGPRAR